MKEILEEFCWDLVSDRTAVGGLQKMPVMCLGPWHGTSKWSQCNSEVNLKMGAWRIGWVSKIDFSCPCCQRKKNLLQSLFLL